MSCNILELKTCEILNSTFRSRVFELNIPAEGRSPENDLYEAKVKIKGTLVQNITGTVVDDRVIFPLTALESTNAFTNYVIDYWADLDGLGKELIAREDLRVTDTPQPDRCLINPVQADLHFGDIVIPVSITTPVLVLNQNTNNYLDFESLTPEQKAELEGLGIFYTSRQISATSGTTALSNINRPDNRTVKVGDLIISTNALSEGRINQVTTVTETHAENSFMLNLRGIEGLSMYSANIAFDPVSGTLTKSQVNVPAGYTLKTADLVISTHPDTLLRLVRITSLTSTTANYTTVVENAITVEGGTIEAGKNLTKIENVIDLKLPENTNIEFTPESPYGAGLAVDRLGNCYVINNFNNNVSITDAAGNSSVLGSTGANPRSVAIDPLGNVYTVNIGAKNITKITPEGVTTILATFASVSSNIAVDQGGNVYTANSNREVFKVTPEGVITNLGTVGYAPISIAVDIAGNIYTANASSNNVSKISSGGIVTTIALGYSPAAVTTDGSGNAFVAGQSTLNKITSSGITSTLTTSLDRPSYIKIHNNIIYITSHNNGKVFKVFQDGTTEIVANLTVFPTGLDVDSAGNVYVLHGNPRIITKIPAVTKRKLALNTEDEIIRIGSYSFAEEYTGDLWIDGKEIFRMVVLDGVAYPAMETMLREQTVGDYVILEYTKP